MNYGQNQLYIYIYGTELCSDELCTGNLTGARSMETSALDQTDSKDSRSTWRFTPSVMFFSFTSFAFM